MSKAMDQMIKARTALVLDHFFFGSLALKLGLVEDTKNKTAATNGVLLKFNPDFITKLNMDKTKGLICHEVLHCGLAHHVRRNGRDLAVYNEACDYAINPMILEAGMQLPDGALIDPNYTGKSVDEIYKDIMSKRPQPQPNEDDKSDDKSDDKNDGQDEQGDGQGDSNDSEQGNEQGEGGEEQGTPDPGGCGGVEDYSGDSDDSDGMTDSDKTQQEQEWQIAMTQAATQAKSRGTLPGGIERLIKKMNAPKVNWREALHRFVDQVSRNDYTFRRINTRFVGRGICLPSLYNEELPPIDVLIDTSASLTQEELEQFAAEIDDILTQYNTTCRVYYADTYVRHTEEFTQDNRPVSLTSRGGGGTDFEAPLAHVMRQEEQPVCLIYLTDGECSNYGPAPDFPVLWVQTQEDVPEYYGTPPYGEVIKMSR